MNLPLILIWLIVIGSIVLIVYLSLTAMKQWNKNNVVVIDNTVSKCAPAFETLIPLESLQCCAVNGNVTANRYVKEVNMVVSSVASNYKQACAGFCKAGVNKSDTTLCVDGDGQADYTACLTRLKPQNCIGISMPVAKNGITYFYGFSATEASCQTKKPC